jgi:RHS repeat-associated protein
VTYNSLHEPLTDTDAAGKMTTYTYNSYGQILTQTNAKNETTTYAYGGIVSAGTLLSITSPPSNGVSAIVGFGYDSFKRIRTVTNKADDYTVTTDYDNLDRKIRVTYPDATYEQFQYTDNVTGVMTLDLTGSRDRLGRWTYRHYNANRQMDSVKDPLDRITLYGWCACGTLTSITDPKSQTTTFNRDLQGRVYQKVFADARTINYLFEGQSGPNMSGATSRLKSSTDALNRRTNYSYFVDDNISQVSYTDTSGNPLNPPTPSVNYTYDANYNRLATMTDGTGLTNYAYYPIGSPPALGAGKLQSVDGPLADDTIAFTYDELGRTLGQSINSVAETVVYDSLGRLTTTRNALGHFERDYDGVTSRLHTLFYRNGQKTNYSYYGNDRDRRLQTLQNLSNGGANLSKFDYTYNVEGQITSWGKVLDTASSGLWFDYDNAQQLVSARNASNPSLASQRYDYGYDDAGNRLSDSNYDPHPVPIGGWLVGTFTTYTANALNQLDSRTVQVNNGVPLASRLLYDMAGNLADDGERTMLEWDAANRLVAVNYTGTTNRSEFTYDGLSRRVKIVEKTGATVTSTKKFVWIGTGISQERDANNAITRRYFAEGEQRPGAGEGIQNYYYTRDHLGSIREVTNSAGAVLARYDYDPYGKRTKLPGKIDVDFGYTGHYHHAPSGLNLTLYRAYNPALGRWISRDPIGEDGGLNLYSYSFNDPVDLVDYTGGVPNSWVPRYGNWGGPDWSGGWRPSQNGGANGPHGPINVLDAAAMRHDMAYGRWGIQSGDRNSDCWKIQDRCARNRCYRKQVADNKLINDANGLRGYLGSYADWYIRGVNWAF